MDYKLHYNLLIERAKERKLDCYTESHHIIPRCMNGSDDKDNLVNLTAREHFVAHILLVKIYPNKKGLIKAVNMMCIGQDERKIHNKMYGWLKEKFSERMSELQKGEGNSQFGTIWIHSLEEKLSKKIKKDELPKYEKLGWLSGRKTIFGKSKRTLDRENKKKANELKKLEKDKFIISLFEVFKNGEYESIRHFHREYETNCSVMTLMNKWKSLPEYKTIEGKAFKV